MNKPRSRCHLIVRRLLEVMDSPKLSLNDVLNLTVEDVTGKGVIFLNSCHLTEEERNQCFSRLRYEEIHRNSINFHADKGIFFMSKDFCSVGMRKYAPLFLLMQRSWRKDSGWPATSVEQPFTMLIHYSYIVASPPDVQPYLHQLHPPQPLRQQPQPARRCL